MIYTSLDFTDGTLVTTAGKELWGIGISSSWLVVRLSDDVIDIEDEVFLDECTFRVIEVEHSVYPLVLQLYLDF